MGNSARSRAKTSGRKKGGDYGQRQKPRRRRAEIEDFSAFTEDEVIAKSELEQGENLMLSNHIAMSGIL